MKVSEIIQYFVEGLEKENLINTITFEKTSEIDYNRANIYPLVNINPMYTEIQNGGIATTFEVVILLQRNDNNHSNKSKLFKDNFIDNLSEATVIGNKIIQMLHMHPELTLNNTPTMSTVRHSRGNILDGVQFTMTIIADNEC